MMNAPQITPWFKVYEPRSNDFLRLFCFPYAGGGASVFRSWSKTLPPTVEIFALQLPGREDRFREPPFTRLESLVRELVQVLIPHLDKPFAFWGHSMGGVVAFEVVRQLRRQHGLNPVHLFVSGCAGPHLMNTNKPIHQLPESEFLAALRRRYGDSNDVLKSPELLELTLPTLRADLTLFETYRYSIEPPLDVPISVFGGLQDPGISRDRLEAWRVQTRASFELQMFPGDHFFFNTAQTHLLQIFNRKLEQLVEELRTGD